METFNENIKSTDPILINNEIKEHLIEASKWAKFLAIMGYIAIGIMMLAAIFMVAVGMPFGGEYAGGRIQTSLIAFIYIIGAVIYIFPTNFLYKSSVSIRQGIESNDQASLTSGFENMKSLYKFIGIFTIVILSFYIVILLGFLLVFALK
jgi:hypothetical protein